MLRIILNCLQTYIFYFRESVNKSRLCCDIYSDITIDGFFIAINLIFNNVGLTCGFVICLNWDTILFVSMW
jgi:hypothetical protein